MPTVAPSCHVKRLMSEQLRADGKLNKRLPMCTKVRFDERVEVLPSDKGSDDDVSMQDAEEDVDFLLSISQDGEWGCTIKESGPAKELNADTSRGKKRHLDDEEPAKEQPEEEPLLRVSSTSSLGNNLKISLTACDDADDAATPMPLITPPSSPRRVRTLSFDGVTTEEAYICEWPCNLTVDNAITSALECAPPSLPLGSSE